MRLVDIHDLVRFPKHLFGFYSKCNKKTLMVLNFEDPHLLKKNHLGCRLCGTMDWIGTKIEKSEKIIAKDQRYCPTLDGSSEGEENEALFPSDFTGLWGKAHDTFQDHFYADDSWIFLPLHNFFPEIPTLPQSPYVQLLSRHFLSDSTNLSVIFHLFKICCLVTSHHPITWNQNLSIIFVASLSI